MDYQINRLQITDWKYTFHILSLLIQIISIFILENKLNLTTFAFVTSSLNIPNDFRQMSLYLFLDVEQFHYSIPAYS